MELIKFIKIAGNINVQKYFMNNLKMKLKIISFIIASNRRK